MKLYLKRLILLSICFLSVLSATSCSPPSGVLLPIKVENTEIKSNFFENDTIRLVREDLILEAFGNWGWENSDGAASNYNLTVTLINKSQKELKLNLSKCSISGEGLEKSEVGAVNEITKPDEIISSAGSNVTDSTIKIAPNEEKIFGVNYRSIGKMNKVGNKVKFVIPADVLTNSQEVVLQFVTATGIKSIPREPQRPAPY